MNREKVKHHKLTLSIDLINCQLLISNWNKFSERGKTLREEEKFLCVVGFQTFLGFPFQDAHRLAPHVHPDTIKILLSCQIHPKLFINTIASSENKKETPPL